MNNPFDELNKQMTDRQQIMTRRDYFAAMAMQAILSSPKLRTGDDHDIVFSSVGLADLLIKELSKNVR